MLFMLVIKCDRARRLIQPHNTELTCIVVEPLDTDPLYPVCDNWFISTSWRSARPIYNNYAKII